VEASYPAAKKSRFLRCTNPPSDILDKIPTGRCLRISLSVEKTWCESKLVERISRFSARMKGLLPFASFSLLSTCSAFHTKVAVSARSACSAGQDGHGKVTENAYLLVEKIDVLQGVVKELQKRETRILEDAAAIEQQHAEDVSVMARKHSTFTDQLEMEIGRLKRQKISDEKRTVDLMNEMEKLSGKVQGLKAKLKRMTMEIEEGDRSITFERKKRAESEEAYEQRIVDLQSMNQEKVLRIISELEEEREKSSRYQTDMMRLTKQAENETSKRKEREEIATSAVEVSKNKVMCLEEKLVSSQQKCLRLQAQIKLQRLVLRGFLENGS
jgi:chromosome segregation ATPase